METAQAGDKSDFTGTLIVIPDVATMASPGENYSLISHICNVNFLFI